MTSSDSSRAVRARSFDAWADDASLNHDVRAGVVNLFHHEREAVAAADADPLTDFGAVLAAREPLLAAQLHAARRAAAHDDLRLLADESLRPDFQRPATRQTHADHGLNDLQDCAERDDRQVPRIRQHEYREQDGTDEEHALILAPSEHGYRLRA